MTLAQSAAAGWGPSDVLALTAIVSSLFVALFTVWASGRQQRQARQEDREDRRWHEAVSLLGPVSGLLVDVDPAALPVQTRLDEAPGHLDERRRRWESEIRPGLLAIAVGSHQESQRGLAEQLSAAVDAELRMVIWYAEAILEQSSELDRFRQQAVDQHREARRLLAELARSFRGEQPGRDE